MLNIFASLAFTYSNLNNVLYLPYRFYIPDITLYIRGSIDRSYLGKGTLKYIGCAAMPIQECRS